MSATAAQAPPNPRPHDARLWAWMLAIVVGVALSRALAFTLGFHGDGDLLKTFTWGAVHIVLTLAPPVCAVLLVTRHGPPRAAPRLAWMVAALLAGTGLALALRIGLIALSGRLLDPVSLASLTRSVGARTLLLGALVAAAVELWRQADIAEAATQRAAADQALLARELATARLQLLQAQLEPHFLFNTLANVRRLYAVDAAQGQAMLDSLAHYLSTAMPSLRRASTPLGQELALAQAWLQLQRMRMGERLRFRHDVPEHLLQRPVPPMMLLTLVENAVKHGLQPRARGGCVCIQAREDDGVLQLSVVDDGVGLRAGGGGGMGLANVRARLEAQFGAQAQLSLEPGAELGTRATLRLPAAAPTGRGVA